MSTISNIAALRVALDALQTNHERNMKYHEYVQGKESAVVATAISSLERSIQNLKELKSGRLTQG